MAVSGNDLSPAVVGMLALITEKWKSLVHRKEEIAKTLTEQL
jgi:hypothetical protein